MADQDTLQKLGLIGGLVFSVVAGGLYLNASTSGGSDSPPVARAAQPPAKVSAAATPPAGSIPVGVLGMMQAPRVVPTSSLKGVRSSLAGALDELNACYDASKDSFDPDGTLYVRLHTTEGGGTRDVQLAFRGPSGKALHACASSALSKLEFDDRVAPDTLVSWPVRWERGKGLRLR